MTGPAHKKLAKLAKTDRVMRDFSEASSMDKLQILAMLEETSGPLKDSSLGYWLREEILNG